MKVLHDRTQFEKFIQREEARRGSLLSFKGESNTTWHSLFFGIFSFIFTRRIRGSASYEPEVLDRITRNYFSRLEAGVLHVFDESIVSDQIREWRDILNRKQASFWIRNSSLQVSRARILQRAECYRNALSGSKPDLLRNSSNSFLGAVYGGVKGVVLGGLGLLIGMGVFWLFLMIIAELF